MVRFVCGTKYETGAEGEGMSKDIREKINQMLELGVWSYFNDMLTEVLTELIDRVEKLEDEQSD